MASRANLYYRLLINWTNDRVKGPQSRNSAFNFPLTQAWDKALLHAEVSVPGLAFEGGGGFLCCRKRMHDHQPALVPPGHLPICWK